MLKLITLIRPFSKYLLIAWASAIIIVSSTPNIPTLKIHTAGRSIRLDYIIHFCEYGILAFIAFLAFTGESYRPVAKKYLLITLFLILFAIIDEYHQKLIPGRSFNVKDILSNVSGVVASLLLSIIIFRQIARKKIT